jgi:hypothetical protein
VSANQNSKVGRSGLEPSTSTVFRAELKSEIVTQACGFLFIRSNPPATFRVTTKLSNEAVKCRERDALRQTHHNM